MKEPETQAEIETRIREWRELSESEGWKLFESKLQGQIVTYRERMLSELDPVKVFAAREVFKALLTLSDWPQREVTAWAAALTNL